MESELTYKIKIKIRINNWSINHINRVLASKCTWKQYPPHAVKALPPSNPDDLSVSWECLGNRINPNHDEKIAINMYKKYPNIEDELLMSLKWWSLLSASWWPLGLQLVWGKRQSRNRSRSKAERLLRTSNKGNRINPNHDEKNSFAVSYLVFFLKEAGLKK